MIKMTEQKYPDDDIFDLNLDEFDNDDSAVTAYASTIVQGKKFGIRNSTIPSNLDSSNSPYFMAMDYGLIRKE